MAQMLFQGHGSYRITTDAGTVIYIDPCAGEGYDAPANLIIVTHRHPDHMQVEKMPHAKDCTILWPEDFQPAAGDYKSLFIPDAKADKPCGIRMTGVQAYNKNHNSDECVGVIIEVDGITFYASGDTSTTEDMTSGKIKDMLIDYAVFPCDGFFNMDVAEASECAALVNAIYSIPIHMVSSFDISEMVLFSDEAADAFQAEGKLIVRPGEVVDLNAKLGK